MAWRWFLGSQEFSSGSFFRRINTHFTAKANRLLEMVEDIHRAFDEMKVIQRIDRQTEPAVQYPCNFQGQYRCQLRS